MAANKTTIADLVAAAHDTNRIGFQLAEQRARAEAAKAEAALGGGSCAFCAFCARAFEIFSICARAFEVLSNLRARV